MGSSTDGSPAAQDALPGQIEEPPQEASGRGLFGRILSAFNPSGDQEAAARSGAEATGLAVLRDLRVDDVAIPKAEIVAVPADIGKEELVGVFRTEGLSRLPVYDGTLDHPVGLVLLKDLALNYGFGAAPAFDLKGILRPILYAPPSMASGVLLQRMQKERIHMALVIDEYGGVDGLVTIEDLIETVIGAIEDEHDEEEGALWKEEAPGVIAAQSIAPLDELEEGLGIRLRGADEDDEMDTIGGLVFLRTGRVPATGEVVVLENGIEIEILDADSRRIKRLRLRLPGAERAAETTAALAGAGLAGNGETGAGGSGVGGSGADGSGIGTPGTHNSKARSSRTGAG
ncbi:transporter associated domain-containing protein [Pseudogemmobacter sonorensis]|uniref:transporter associated domain-containing protein n=1 Tax=Pseudogemmobacter sonorensis TaxID=2989681 RepID=UPI0036C0E99D